MKQIFRHHRLAILFFFIPWSVYFLFLWSHLLFFSNGNLIAGHPYVWADWSMHIALVSNFAFRPVSDWFNSLPVFSGAPVTYPFFTNLVSGLLWRFGFSLPVSMLIPSIVWTAFCLYALYSIFYSLLGSVKQAVLAATLFFGCGGVGFWYILYEKGWKALLDSTVIVTQISDHQIEMNTVIASMFIPQRAFLLGFPLAIGVMWVILNDFVFHWRKTAKLTAPFAGLAAASLLVIHTHSFVVIVLFSVWIFLFRFRQIQKWLTFGIPAIILSTVLYFTFLRSGLHTASFFTLNPGWIGHGSFAHWIFFWIKNWGLFLPLAVFGTGLLWFQQKQKLLIVVMFFWVLFMVANLIQFQPQEWDNTKLFAWVSFGLSIPVTLALRGLLCSYKRSITFPLVVFLAVLLVLSGATDLVHNLDTKRKSFQMLSSDQIVLAEYVRKMTPPDSVFLTRPVVNNPISMIGARSVYLGYPGWAFSYGLDYSTRESKIRAVFEGTDSIESLQSSEKIEYIFIDSHESETQWLEAIPHRQKLFENDAGTVYSIR